MTRVISKYTTTCVLLVICQSLLAQPGSGGLDLDAYCRSKGHKGTYLVADNRTAYGWRCVAQNETLVGIDMVDACLWQYKGALPEPRFKYEDPYSWRCTARAVIAPAPQPPVPQISKTSEGNWRQYQDAYSKSRGNCPDCADGEAKAEAIVSVAHGVYVDINDPPCGDARFNAPSLPADVKNAAAAAFYKQAGPAARFAVDLGELGLASLIKAGVNDAGTLGQVMRSITNQPQVASCSRLAVVLPKSVTITRIVKGDNCPGWCGWTGEPVTEEVDKNLFAVSVVAKNWSHNEDRQAYLRVYYKR